MQDHQWTEGRAKLVLLERDDEPGRGKLVIAVNGSEETVNFCLPPAAGPHWSMRFTSTASGNVLYRSTFPAAPLSVALLTSDAGERA